MTIIKVNLGALVLFLKQGSCKIFFDYCKVQISNNTDLVVLLFKGYVSNPDKKISEYVLRKKDAYKEFLAITANKLMEFISNKYLTLVEEGSLNKPSAMDEKTGST